MKLKQIITHRFFPLGVSLALALILVFLIKDFVRLVIVEPMLDVFWVVYLVVDTLPQCFFWVLFIFGTLYFIIRSLSRESEEKPNRRVQLTQSRGLVAEWVSSLENAKKADYARWLLSQSLLRLSWRVLAPGKPASLVQIQEQVESGQLDFPPEIQAYFQNELRTYEPPSRFDSLRFWKRRPPTPLDLPPEDVITFLENKHNLLSGD